MTGKKMRFLNYLLLAAGAVVVIYPFFIMVMNSVKPGNEIFNRPLALPSHITWEGYRVVFQQLNILRLLLNSVFVATCVTLLSATFSLMASYAIIKCEIPGKDIWFKVILSSMMIPSVLLLIPQYQMFNSWGWVDTYHPLIWPFMISAYNVFLMMQYMKSINNEFIEAARIDGAGEPRILFSVIAPMSLPGISTVAILTFMNSWNDFMNPLLYIKDQSKMTIQIAIYNFQSAIPNGQLQQLWAATTLVTLPIVIVFLCVQKNFVKAFTGVGLK